MRAFDQMFNVDLVRFKNNQYHVEEISDDENFVKKLRDDNAELLNEHTSLKYFCLIDH